MSQARSLWRLELARTKWSGGFINWYHPMRIRHLTTGRYLGVNENNELVLVSFKSSALSFYLLLTSYFISFRKLKQRQHKLLSVCVKRKTIRKLCLKTKTWKLLARQSSSTVTQLSSFNMLSQDYGSVIKVMKQKRKVWERLKRNKPFFTKKEKWMMGKRF